MDEGRVSQTDGGRPKPAAPDPRPSRLLDLVGASLTAAGTRQTAAAADVAPERTVVASGFTQPTDFQFLPDGRILVAEKNGRIRIVDEDGDVLRRPLYRVPTLTQGERGLGGLTVDPDFADNGYIYVAYTTIFARDRLARCIGTPIVAARHATAHGMVEDVNAIGAGKALQELHGLRVIDPLHLLVIIEIASCAFVLEESETFLIQR